MFLDLTRQLLTTVESQAEVGQTDSSRNPGVVIVEDNPAARKSCCSF